MSTTTTNRGYIIQSAGENPGTWGDPELNSIFQTIDTNLGGVTNVALSSSNVTLSTSQLANGTIRLSGTLTANVLVIFPAVQGWWTVENLTTGNFVAQLLIGALAGIVVVDQGSVNDIMLDGTNVKFRNLPPVGSYLDLIDATVPAWIVSSSPVPYLLCDGSTFSAVTYPYLNTKLGGTTLPDLRGRSRFYLDGGTGRVTTANSGIDGNTRLSAGGVDSVTLGITQIPAHDHGGQATGTLNFNTHTRGILTDTGPVQVPVTAVSATTGDLQWFNASTSNFGGQTTGPSDPRTIASQGGGLLHNNMPPAQISGITMIRAA